MNAQSDFGKVETVRARDKNELLEESHQHFEALRQQDQQAREENSLVGQYFPVPVGASTHAYYVITDLREEDRGRVKARVEAVQGLLNDITCPNWGKIHWIPLELANRYLERREKFENIYGDQLRR